MAAAGLTEESVNDNRNQEQLREKLDDLQRQHRAKKKGDTAVVSSPSARSKVRSWRASLRRRRGGKGDDEGGGAADAIIEEKSDDGVQGRDRNSADTDRSTPTVPSVEPEERDSSDGLGSHQNTTSSDEPSSSEPNSTAESPNRSGPAAPPAATPYFPPAYRPASVRSLHLHQAGSSSTAGTSGAVHPSGDLDIPSAAEKVRAPGYYPAPATAEGEIALAVASRTDGKGRMPPPPEVNDSEEQNTGEHTAHVATDDKRVLERMRMAASAPPQTMAGEGEDGPSAPHVEVDESGFERMELEPPITLNADPSASSSSPSQPPAMAHPSLPAPPPRRPSFSRSYSVEREVHEQLDELNLLPSAPPRLPPSRLANAETPSTPPITSDEIIVPSAPPLLPEGDEEEDGGETIAPATAPPLPESEEEDGDEVAQRDFADQAAESSRTATVTDGLSEVEENDSEDVLRRPSEAPSEPRVFLPRYEP